MRLAILDDYQQVALDMAEWKRLPPDIGVTAFTDHLADEDALAARLAAFEIIVAMRERTPFPGSLLARLPRLRLLVQTGISCTTIDLAAARARGIAVCNTQSVLHTTAELTFGLILALLRNIAAEHMAIRRGGWQVGLGRALSGQTLGILGLGRQGQDVARIAQSFGMNVIAWSENLTEARAASCCARRVERDALFREADIVTIHLVLSARTEGLVGARELSLMKRDAFLVNTSRGPIVDEDALVAALEAGSIAGAALDVFAAEPLPATHPFRRLDNVLTTPHIGYVTRENYRSYYTGAVEDVLAWLQGAPIRVLNGPMP